MSKRVKIWYHSGSTSDIREFTIHRALCILLSVFAGFSIIGASFIGYDYIKLKTISIKSNGLGQTVHSLNAEITTQRKQIQQFAGEIETIKKLVTNLSNFEDRVRLIADIKQTSDSSGLIGIGSIPADALDPDLPLTQKHNSLIREMHQQVTQAKVAAEKHALDFEQLIKQLEQKRNILASTPSIRPVDGWITSGFGNRVSPFTGQKEFHSGLDIANAPGTKIIAPANGRVSVAAEKLYIGNLIVIDHDHGRVTQYGHLKEILVKPGQEIKRGDVIGLIGNTGRSTGPHLHYEVLINGTPVNPLKYILN
ncbi:MAG: metalloendopeptidase [Desulfobacterales bacterium RIFOXYA12_FULL_46_15]|nr:MAG: metalloendopeptidase [Desulfobacula sp. GWF2_41_7]OGR22376.1 MAG: metalloendopeptidase [Desulfobacterales bacterium RIFOXYA12_FULL_46_15]